MQNARRFHWRLSILVVAEAASRYHRFRRPFRNAMRIALFVPCYVDQAAPKVAIATATLLQRLGHDVIFPDEQTCCGQPAFNTGYWPQAAELAVRQTRLFLDAGVDAVVCPSGSCTAMQKVFYPTLLAGTPAAADADELAKISWELSTFLVHRLGLVDVGARFPGAAVLHKSCHSLRELNARTEAQTLLRHVRELTLVDLPGEEECCGFGGTFAIKNPDVSTAMGEIKIDAVVGTGAEWVVSGDSSCLMHLAGLMERRGLSQKTVHLAEVLASV
jgi:L-lactate dehydrogenase complex protein LldE